MGREIYLLFICLMALSIASAGQEDKAGYWLDIADKFANIGSYGDAINAYNKATDLDPKMTGAWSKMGDAYQNMSKYNDAIISYEKAIELDPGQAIIWFSKGNAYYYLENFASDRSHMIDKEKGVYLAQPPKYACIKSKSKEAQNKL